MVIRSIYIISKFILKLLLLFARHCDTFTFYREFFNGLRASNQRGGPKLTFESDEFRLKWKWPAEWFQNDIQ